MNFIRDSFTAEDRLVILFHFNPAIAPGNAESRHSCPECLQGQEAYFAGRGISSGEKLSGLFQQFANPALFHHHY